MSRTIILIALVAVVAAFALGAGCTFTVPGQNATATPRPTTPAGTVTHTGTVTTLPTATGTAAVTVTVTATPTPTPAGPGSISGAKWNDLNGDHKRDGGEAGLAGWTIRLEMQEANGPNWNEVARTTTGADGTYAFTGLAEGHYRVYEVAQAGWTQTYPTDNAGMHNLVISNGRPSWPNSDFGNTGGTVVTGTATSTVTATPTATATGTATGTATATGTVTGTATVTATATTQAGQTFVADTLTARNLGYDKSTLTAPAGATMVLTFVNDDAGVPHNFALYTDSSATTAIFKGGIVTGQVTTVYTFTAPSQPGTYFYRCDVHPTTMTGSFVVT